MRQHVHGPACEAPGVAERGGVELVGYHCLEGNPGFKLAMATPGDRWLLYLAHMWANGWSILDVTDPAAPQYLRFIPGPAMTWTIQIQVADGLMITALEKPPPGWGSGPSVEAEEGVLVWDLADPLEPALAGTYRTGGTGTHRNFYAGGRYAYLAAGFDDTEGRSLAILDVSDARNPAEVSRWSWPTQAEPGRFASYMHGPAHVEGSLAYVSYGKVGALILDISDPTAPSLVSHLSLGDLGSRIGCHTALPYLGSKYMIVSGEAIDEGRKGELNYTFVVDIADIEKPKVISSLPAPRPSDGGTYWDRGGRFGIHNHHHQQGQPHLFPNDSTVFTTWFNAGLRVYDISDPYEPAETAYFVPEAPRERRGPLPAQQLATQFEDVIVDARGYIYCTDKNHGLFVLRMEDR